jgi:hypothetical protein
MRKGFLLFLYEEMRKYLVICEEAVSVTIAGEWLMGNELRVTALKMIIIIALMILIMTTVIFFMS